MVKMSNKNLKILATSLNAIDLTFEQERIKGLGCLTKIAYSVGVYGCNGFVFKGCDDKIYAVTKRTGAFWLYGL